MKSTAVENIGLRMIFSGFLLLIIMTSYSKAEDVYDNMDYGSSYDLYDYEDDTDKNNENSTANQMYLHNDALVALFGTEEHVNSSIYKVALHESYLRLSEVKICIQTAMEDPARISGVTEEQKKELFRVLKILDNRMGELLEASTMPWLLTTFVNSSYRLSSVLPNHLIFNDLVVISEKIKWQEWICEDGYLLRLWHEIIEHSSLCVTSSCNQTGESERRAEAILGLVSVSMAVENSTHGLGWFIDVNEQYAKNKISLLNTISEEKNLIFLTRAMGPQEVDSLVEHILCSLLTLQVVDRVLSSLNSPPVPFRVSPSPSVPVSPTNPDDLLTLLEVQKTLVEISEGMKNSGTRAPGDSRLGRYILDSFMNLVDNTMSIDVVDIWAQIPLDEAKEKLHEMLLSNENFVGTFSDVILSDNSVGWKENLTLEKNSLSVSLSQFDVQENSSTVAQFQYDDVKIWTEDMSSFNHSADENLKVYALRYKSWSEMMRDIVMEHYNMSRGNFTHSNTSDLPDSDELDVNNSFDHATHSRHVRSVDGDSVAGEIALNKSFVGAGGVISLSMRQGGEKKSIPVSYWMKFNVESSFPLSSGQPHLCLSCEYLDPETITWKSRGCHVVTANDSGVTCKCNHTTNFAAFMMPAEIVFESSEEEQTV